MYLYYYKVSPLYILYPPAWNASILFFYFFIFWFFQRLFLHNRYRSLNSAQLFNLYLAFWIWIMIWAWKVGSKNAIKSYRFRHKTLRFVLTWEHIKMGIIERKKTPNDLKNKTSWPKMSIKRPLDDPKMTPVDPQNEQKPYPLFLYD